MNGSNKDDEKCTPDNCPPETYDRTTLPVPRVFRGQIDTDENQSTPCWNPPIEPPGEPGDAPNVIVILLDDVGFGATSTFGGPIDTPRFTKLADEGIKYTRFHTTSMCAPTRASLLTGRSPHNANFGAIIEYARGYPGYSTEIPRDCATIGKILKYNGYTTAWFGKNHNVPQWEGVAGYNNEHWPNNMGFDKFYGFIGADTDQYHPLLWDNYNPVQPYEGKSVDEYHLDDDLAENAIKFLRRHKSITPDRPFFIHYAPGATHAPHHVKQKFVEPYEAVGDRKSRFAEGWDAIRAETLVNQKSMGICDENTRLSDRPTGLTAFEDLEDDTDGSNISTSSLYIRMAELYAGYLTMADDNVGKVLDEINRLGYEDNTLVIYIAGDNGGSAEGTTQGTTNQTAAVANFLSENLGYIKREWENLGGEMHYNHMPAEWAWAFNSPMQWAKRYASHFGGTRNGMVMKFPKCISADAQGTIRTEFHHVMDIVPTILAAANIPIPSIVDGVSQRAMDGRSMVYTWAAEGQLTDPQPEPRPILFELLGNRGLYDNGYMWCTTPKIYCWAKRDAEGFDDGCITFHENNFESELYDLSTDFSQGNNLLGPGENGENLTHPMRQEWENIAQDMRTQFLELAGDEDHNILPMAYTSNDLRAGQVGMPKLTPGMTTFTYIDRVSRIPEYCAPDLVGRSFKMTATFWTSEQTEGAIVTLGGRFGGWGLVVLDSQPIWVYKTSHWPDFFWELPSASERPELQPLEDNTKYQVIVDFTISDGEDLGMPGVCTMEVKKILDGIIMPDPVYSSDPVTFSTTPRAVFTECETFDIGCDHGTPLMEQYKDKIPFDFNGTIEEVVFEIKTIEDREKLARLHQAKLQAKLRTE